MGAIFDVEEVSADNPLDFHDKITTPFLTFNLKYLNNGWNCK